MNIYAVLHQWYIYALDEPTERKYELEDNFSVKGLFSTEEGAKRYITQTAKEDAYNFCGSSRKEKKFRDNMIQDIIDHHWIEEFELDKELNEKNAN